MMLPRAAFIFRITIDVTYLLAIIFNETEFLNKKALRHALDIGC